MEETETGYEKLQLYSETRKRLDELYNDTVQVCTVLIKIALSSRPLITLECLDIY